LTEQPSVGDQVVLRAIFTNRDTTAVVLPCILVGSDEGERLPIVTVRVSGPEGGSAVRQPSPASRSAGPDAFILPDRLTEQDFMTLNPHEEFDVCATRWGRATLHLGRFEKPGTYRLYFHYSTLEIDARKWLGKDEWEPPSRRLREILEQVPRLVVVDSLDFVVSAPNGR
jgi:hypothetical protein